MFDCIFCTNCIFFNRYHPLHNHFIDVGEVPSEDLMGSFLPLMWTFTWLVADICLHCAHCRMCWLRCAHILVSSE